KLAIPDSAIEHLDYMVVSVHSAFTMHYKEMTARVLQALAQPKVKIFGHPTARLIGKRDGIDLDWDKIFEFCSKKNIALEINSWPERLDLPDSLVKRALDLGCSFTIDTDAHEESQMENMRYGVAVSQRGWVQSKNVMNTLSLAEFKKWIMV
ncbi:MAG: DNA polymerase/3'-5' exonuclease PolX, partial [Patescibacteria group bacterium]